MAHYFLNNKLFYVIFLYLKALLVYTLLYTNIRYKQKRSINKTKISEREHSRLVSQAIADAAHEMIILDVQA